MQANASQESTDSRGSSNERPSRSRVKIMPVSEIFSRGRRPRRSTSLMATRVIATLSAPMTREARIDAEAPRPVPSKIVGA